MLYSFNNKQVELARDCFVAPTAVVLGSVELDDESSVWFNTVIRGDTDSMYIGKRSNVQDNSVIHTDAGIPLNIGDGVSIGHGCIIHGCGIGHNTLIGMGSVILNHAKIGNNCIIGAHALVTQGMVIPDNSLALGSPAKVIRALSENEIENNKINAQIYVDRGKEYLKGLAEQTQMR